MIALAVPPTPPALPTPFVPPAPPSLPGGPGITLERLESWLPALKLAGIYAAGGLLGVVLLALVLRWQAPRVYWWTFGCHLLRLRMRRTWRTLTLNANLTTSDRMRSGVLGGLKVQGQSLTPLLPRMYRLRYTRNGATALVALLPGQTPDDFVRVGEAFAHAWGVHAVRVTSPGRGRVHLSVLRNDPLVVTEGRGVAVEASPFPRRPTVPIPTVPRVPSVPALRQVQPSFRPPAVPAKVATLADLRVKVGTREDARPWVMDLGLYPHWLITGATRSGKSTLINAAVAQWLQRPVALVGIDCKGGMELAPFAPRLSALACDRQEAAVVLTAVLAIAHDRMRQCRQSDARNIWQLPGNERPVPIIVLIDELAELYLIAGKEEKDAALRATTALLRLGQLGAALGIHLIVAGQRVGSDLGSGVTALRAQLAGRVCHKVNDPETADMTLSDLYPDAVDAAQAITANERGVGITTDDASGWMRARSEYLDPQSIRTMVACSADLTPTLPGLDRPTF